MYVCMFQTYFQSSDFVLWLLSYLFTEEKLSRYPAILFIILVIVIIDRLCGN